MRSKLLSAAIGGILGGVGGANLPSEPEPQSVEFIDSAIVTLPEAAQAALEGDILQAHPEADLASIKCKAVNGRRKGVDVPVIQCRASGGVTYLRPATEQALASAVESSSPGLSWRSAACSQMDGIRLGEPATIMQCSFDGARVATFDNAPVGRSLKKYGEVPK
jgi:hypothetical protein